MKKKISKRDNVNLFFSAFLILAYVVCGYFFAQFAESLSESWQKAAVLAAIFVVFGLLVFYATRVGEGKAIKRFSVITLVLLDLPALYIILASVITVLPLHDFFTNSQTGSPSIVAFMAAIALGYGIPYTFLSGFETIPEDAEVESEAEPEEEPAALEGGVEADLEKEEEEAVEEEPVDEIVVEGVAADEEVTEAADEEEKEETAE